MPPPHHLTPAWHPVLATRVWLGASASSAEASTRRTGRIVA
jgi:hypothetical protein